MTFSHCSSLAYVVSKTLFSIIGKKQYFACDGDKEIIFDNWGVCLMEKFQDKYRIQSARLKDWDYSSAGAYFITICTRDRIHFFGEIVNGKMAYTPLGILAETLWHEIKQHTKNIELGEFVVMPNHIHGILMTPPRRDVACNVSIRCGARNVSR